MNWIHREELRKNHKFIWNFTILILLWWIASGHIHRSRYYYRSLEQYFWKRWRTSAVAASYEDVHKYLGIHMYCSGGSISAYHGVNVVKKEVSDLWTIDSVRRNIDLSIEVWLSGNFSLFYLLVYGLYSHHRYII